MKKFRILLATTILTFAITCSVFAKDITLKVEANKSGKVKVYGESKKNKEDVTIKVEDNKKIYYLDQNKTNEKGEFQFEFEVDPSKDYKGRVNVGGEIQDFQFKTKEKEDNPEKPSKPSGGGSSSGGGGGSSSGGGGGSSTNPSNDKKDDSNDESKNGKKNVTRLAGKDRFETSIKIADRFKSENEGKIDNVIIASAYGYADALSGSVLAKKVNAPMLLVGKTVEESKTTMDYINTHLNKGGKIYILGGTGVINNKFIDKFKSMGYSTNNIKRLGGKNRLETCKYIADEVNVEKGKGIIIASANGFADALSASAPAAIKQYPVLLTNKDSISNEIKSVITKVQPTEVYVVGGQGVISSNIEKEVKSLSKNAKVVRLGGKDRYETSYKIVDNFKEDKNEALMVASGNNFPDALSGAPLAAKLNASLLLVDKNSVDRQKSLVNKLNAGEEIILGGQASISDSIKNKLLD
ncbi:hypothetical protein DP130_11655 [Clostridium tetani]|uniref:Cell wall-binding repeat-containing protein n=1 Tax=Clostridium tetani TaxID=1513 RepID=A0A4Q0V9B9_CLOTA|nr:cell wall-binding repeat-containing protein [Clostridium tetani]RXI45701.1 hypothetical protein DP130_11655 [Clostridium tetani]